MENENIVDEKEMENVVGGGVVPSQPGTGGEGKYHVNDWVRAPRAIMEHARYDDISAACRIKGFSGLFVEIVTYYYHENGNYVESQTGEYPTEFILGTTAAPSWDYLIND